MCAEVVVIIAMIMTDDFHKLSASYHVCLVCCISSSKLRAARYLLGRR